MADRNRQVAVVCAPCAYRLRGSRAQLVRGIPACPLCGERMIPEEWAVAEVILKPAELERHPEYEERHAAEILSEIKSCNAQGSMHADRGMSDRWLRQHAVNLSPRRWVREDFEALAATFTAPRADPAMPF